MMGWSRSLSPRTLAGIALFMLGTVMALGLGLLIAVTYLHEEPGIGPGLLTAFAVGIATMFGAGASLATTLTDELGGRSGLGILTAVCLVVLLATLAITLMRVTEDIPWWAALPAGLIPPLTALLRGRRREPSEGSLTAETSRPVAHV